MANSRLVKMYVLSTFWLTLNYAVTSLSFFPNSNKTELFYAGDEEYFFEIKNSGKIKLVKSIGENKSSFIEFSIVEFSIVEFDKIRKNESKVYLLHHLFNFSLAKFNFSHGVVIERYGVAAVYRSLSISFGDNATLNVGCIVYKSGTRKNVSEAYFLINKGTIEFEISIKGLKHCDKNTCEIKHQKTASFLDVVFEVRAPYFTTAIIKKAQNDVRYKTFRFGSNDLIFSSTYRNGSNYSFNMDLEYPKMTSSSAGNIFTIRFPVNQSEYYYSLALNEDKNITQDINKLFNNASLQIQNGKKNTTADIDNFFNNVSVQVRRQSGLASIFRKSKDNTRAKVLDIKIYSIEEVDSLGNKIIEQGHYIKNFTNQYFSVSQLSTRLNYGISTTVFNYTVLYGNASISAEFMIFNTAGNITVESGETYNIVPGTIKFNIVIRDWAFCGTRKASCQTSKNGSYLDLQLEIKATGKNREKKYTKQSNKVKAKKSLKSKYLPISFDIDQSSVTFSSMVFIDGNWTDMPVGFPRYDNKNNNSLFIMRFPLSQSKIIYDPVIDISPAFSVETVYSSAHRIFSNSCIIFFLFVSVYVCKILS